MFDIIWAPLGWAMYGIQEIVKNYGWALVIFTILLKLVLFPLSIKQQKSTAKMAAFQPKIKELQKKYGKDKQKLQEEQMKLYEQEGYNPAGGCLPMLVQFGVLFGIIDVVYKPLKHLIRIAPDVIKSAEAMMVEILGKPTSSAQLMVIKSMQEEIPGVDKLAALFTPDQVDKIMNFDMMFLGINIGDIPTWGFNLLIIIPILSGLTAFLTSWISTRQQEKMGQTMQKSMKYMMYAMPLMSLWFCFSVPAGVGVYWIISNLTAIAQTIILGKIYTPEKLANMNDKNKDKNIEKMRIKREKIEEIQKAQRQKYIDKGLTPPEPKVARPVKKIQAPEIIDDGISAQDRIKLARKRLAEKYGETYDENE